MKVHFGCQRSFINGFAVLPFSIPRYRWDVPSRLGVKHPQKDFEGSGLPLLKFHGLRHTFLTTTLQNEVDVKTVSAIPGHYGAGFILRTYTHTTRQAQDAAAITTGKVMAQMV